jgi:hypothetical protein
VQAQRTGREACQRKIRVDKVVDQVAARVAVNRVDSPAMTAKAAAKKPEVVEVRKVAAAALAVTIDKYKTIAPF